MNAWTLGLIALVGSGCGIEGPVGPQGPQGEQGPAGNSGKLVFAPKEGSSVTKKVVNVSANNGALVSIPLAGVGGLPADARTVYVHATACIAPAGTTPFVLSLRSPAGGGQYSTEVDTACGRVGANEVAAFLPVGAEQQVELALTSTSLTQSPAADVTVTLLGWYE